MMRVIAGTARSMPLSTPKGNDTRPTTDRIKETLFNMLQNYIPDCVFVDVCSGSGAIGIEALSRGASHAYFIDRDQACIQCIKNNLTFTKLDQKSTILKQDACTALNMIHEKAVDVVFADPPYEAGMERSLLGTLSKMQYVTGDTLVIIEALIDTDFSFASEYGFDILKEKCYKTNKHVWLTRQA